MEPEDTERKFFLRGKTLYCSVYYYPKTMHLQISIVNAVFPKVVGHKYWFAPIQENVLIEWLTKVVGQEEDVKIVIRYIQDINQRMKDKGILGFLGGEK